MCRRTGSHRLHQAHACKDTDRICCGRSNIVSCGIVQAGATVPLTGFGHLLAEGIRKSLGEDGFLGIFTGGMTAASGGITAAILFGLIAALIFKQKDKN